MSTFSVILLNYEVTAFTKQESYMMALSQPFILFSCISVFPHNPRVHDSEKMVRLFVLFLVHSKTYFSHFIQQLTT